MNASQANDLGERITRLEVLMEGAAKQAAVDQENIKALTLQVTNLIGLLNQAKGARLTIAALIALAGMFGGLIAKYLPMLLALPR